MFDSIDKGRCPELGKFVRIYQMAGTIPATVDLAVDIYLFRHSPGRISSANWQLTHQPAKWRKTFVMECYSSFGWNNVVYCYFDDCQV